MSKHVQFLLLGMSVAIALTMGMLIAGHDVSPELAGILAASIISVLIILAVLRRRQGESSKPAKPILRLIALYVIAIAIGVMRAAKHGWSIGDTIGSIGASILVTLYTIFYFQQKKTDTSAK
jgi:hypothetical protein